MLHVRTLCGWAVFGALYLLTWDAAVSRLIARARPVAEAASAAAPASRAVFLALALYAACGATLMLCLALLLLFSVMRGWQCLPDTLLATHRGGFVVRWLVRALNAVLCPEVLFAACSPRLLPFHAAVFAAALFVALVFALVYVSDRDLASPQATQSAAARTAIAMPLPGGLAYVGFAVASSVAAAAAARSRQAHLPHVG